MSETTSISGRDFGSKKKSRLSENTHAVEPKLTREEIEEEAPRLRDIIAAKTSFFFVSKKFESLDYTPITNQLEKERQKTQSYGSVCMKDCLRISLFIMAGIVTALLGVLLEYSIHTVGHWKYLNINNFIFDNFENKPYELITVTAVRFTGIMIPAMIGTAVVVFIAPYAKGGGVAQCIGYLNGIRIPKVLSVKGLIVKIISTICMCTSGLAGGKEGPAIHIGATAAGSLPSILPWLQFRSDRERRDLAAAGFGAGIAVVFGSPIGGMLLALEEAISFWDIGLMWKQYLCCIVAYAVGNIFATIVLGVEVKVGHPELSTLGLITPNVTKYELFEIFPFALLAVVGGCLGSIVVQIHKFVYLITQKYVRTNFRKMCLTFTVACILTFFQEMSIRFIRNCSKITEIEARQLGNDSVTRRVHQLYCENDEHNDMSLLFQQTHSDIFRTFFGTEVLQMSSLSVFSILYFFLISLSMGLSMSFGVFVPQLIFGASWGRLFGTFLSEMWPDAKWAIPAKYAYIGAVAQLSATIGKTFSILVIMAEASGSISFSFPLMVVVMITKVVGNFFTAPFYYTQMLLQGYPFLYAKPPPLSLEITTSSIMSTPLITFPPSPTVEMIISVLKTTPHHGFPIIDDAIRSVETHRLLGLILRQQLLLLLKHNAYKLPPPSTTKEKCESVNLYLKFARKRLNEQEIFAGVDPNYYSTKIDLTPYYDAFPHTVTAMSPAVQTYTLFRNMALRHLIVMQDNTPVGMITRKELAKFHTFENFFRLGVIEMLVKK